VALSVSLVARVLGEVREVTIEVRRNTTHPFGIDLGKRSCGAA
jgi:hypothetical protein